MGKSLVLSVSVRSGCYRHIQISEDATLFELHETMLDSVNFFDDHMHVFFMDNRAWVSQAEYVCPACDDMGNAKGFSDEVKLSEFQLGKGDKFLYIFDFGDEWRFSIKVLRVLDEDTQESIVLKSVGEISQYGDFDDDEEDDDDDEEDDDDDEV